MNARDMVFCRICGNEHNPAQSHRRRLYELEVPY